LSTFEKGLELITVLKTIFDLDHRRGWDKGLIALEALEGSKGVFFEPYYCRNKGFMMISSRDFVEKRMLF
jgi:hypothetical protein